MSWNFPLLRKLSRFYKTHGLIKTILFVIIIFIGTKVIILNGFVYLCNYLFGFGWKYAPILKYLDNLV